MAQYITLPNGDIILDGDTLVKKDGTRIRITGGDAPEIAHLDQGIRREPMAAESTAFTQDFVQRPDVTYQSTGETDKYGRELGTFSDARGKTLAEHQVGRGLAFPTGYGGATTDVEYNTGREQQYAQRVLLGLAPEIYPGQRESLLKRGDALRRANFSQADRQVNLERRGGFFGDALKRGWDSTQQMVGGLASLAGDVSGWDSLKEYGNEVVEQNQFDLMANPARVGSLEEVDGLGSAVTWAFERVTEQAPNIAATIASGGTAAIARGGAGVVARQAAKRYAKETASTDALNHSLGRIAINRIAQEQTNTAFKVGIGSGAVGMNTGETQLQFQQEGIDNPLGVILTGLAKGSLDTIGINRLLTPYARAKGLTQREAIAAWGGMPQELLKTAAIEGGTEGLQTLLDEAAILAQTGKPVDWGSVGEATLIGSLTGGTLGVPSAANMSFKKRRLNRELNEGNNNEVESPSVQPESSPTSETVVDDSVQQPETLQTGDVEQDAVPQQQNTDSLDVEGIQTALTDLEESVNTVLPQENIESPQEQVPQEELDLFNQPQEELSDAQNQPTKQTQQPVEELSEDANPQQTIDDTQLDVVESISQQEAFTKLDAYTQSYTDNGGVTADVVADDQVQEFDEDNPDLDTQYERRYGELAEGFQIEGGTQDISDDIRAVSERDAPVRTTDGPQRAALLRLNKALNDSVSIQRVAREVGKESKDEALFAGNLHVVKKGIEEGTRVQAREKDSNKVVMFETADGKQIPVRTSYITALGRRLIKSDGGSLRNFESEADADPSSVTVETNRNPKLKQGPSVKEEAFYEGYAETLNVLSKVFGDGVKAVDTNLMNAEIAASTPKGENVRAHEQALKRYHQALERAEKNKDQSEATQQRLSGLMDKVIETEVQMINDQNPGLTLQDAKKAWSEIEVKKAEYSALDNMAVNNTPWAAKVAGDALGYHVIPRPKAKGSSTSGIAIDKKGKAYSKMEALVRKISPGDTNGKIDALIKMNIPQDSWWGDTQQRFANQPSIQKKHAEVMTDLAKASQAELGMLMQSIRDVFSIDADVNRWKEFKAKAKDRRTALKEELAGMGVNTTSDFVASGAVEGAVNTDKYRVTTAIKEMRSKKKDADASPEWYDIPVGEGFMENNHSLDTRAEQLERKIIGQLGGGKDAETKAAGIIKQMEAANLADTDWFRIAAAFDNSYQDGIQALPKRAETAKKSKPVFSEVTTDVELKKAEHKTRAAQFTKIINGMLEQLPGFRGEVFLTDKDGMVDSAGRVTGNPEAHISGRPGEAILSINLDAVTNPTALRRVLMHEIVGHYGVHNLLDGKQVDQFAQWMDNTIQEAIKNGDTNSKLVKAYEGVRQKYSVTNNREMMGEVIARFAEIKHRDKQFNNHVDKNLWQTFKDFLKDIFSKMGLDAKPHEVEKAIDNLLDLAYAKLKEGNKPPPAVSEMNYFSATAPAMTQAKVKKLVRETAPYLGRKGKDLMTFLNKATIRLRSLHHQVKTISPKMARILTRAESMSRSETGRWKEKLHTILDGHLGRPKAGAFYSKEQKAKLAELYDEIKTGNVTSPAGKALQQFLKDFHGSVKTEGLNILHYFGVHGDFPRALNNMKIREKQESFIEFLQTIDHPNEVLQRKLNKDEAQQVYHHILSHTSFEVGVRRQFKETAKLYEALLRKDFMQQAYDAGWHHTDPLTVLNFHIDSLINAKVHAESFGGWRDVINTDEELSDAAMTARRMQYADAFGKNLLAKQNGFEDYQTAVDMGWIKETQGADGKQTIMVFDPSAKVKDEYNQVAVKQGEAEAKRLVKLVNIATGNAYFDAPPALRKLNEWVATIEILALLTFSAVGSIPELGATISREAYSLKDVIQNLKEVVHSVKGDKRHLGEVLGLTMRSAVASAAVADFGYGDARSVPQRLNHTFFLANLQHVWTKMTRNAALHVGLAGWKRNAHYLKHGTEGEKAAARNFFGITDGKTKMENAPFSFTPEYIQQVAADLQNDSLDMAEYFERPENRELRAFMHHFVDDTNVLPSALDIPAFGSDPHWKFAMIFKTFLYGYGRRITIGFAKRGVDVWKAGGKDAAAAYKAALPSLALVAFTMPLAILSQELRDGIRYDMWGDEPPSDDDELWEYANRILGRSGILGPLDLGVTAFEQAEWGNSVVATMLGPAATHVDTIMKEGLFSKQAVKRTLPVVGQFPALWD